MGRNNSKIRLRVTDVLFSGMSCKASCNVKDVLSCSPNGEIITKTSVRELGKPLTRKGTNGRHHDYIPYCGLFNQM